MRAAQLPSLRGIITNGGELRVETAKALSEAERYLRRMGSTSTGAVARITALQAFVDAMQDKLDQLNDRPVSIAITPSTVSIAAAATQQLTVTATQVDGGTANVAASASTLYTSSDPTKATVSATGLVTGVAAGTTTITARYLGRTATKLVTVTA